MRKSNFALSRKYKIGVLVLALIISTGGIAHNKNAEARESGSGVTQAELEMVFGKQNVKTVDIFNMAQTSNNLIKPEYNIKLSKVNSDLIWELCVKNNLSYELVLSVFHYESRFNPKAINKANKDGSQDMGFSQLNSRYINTYKGYAIQYCNFPKNQVFDVFNADHNIRAGIGTITYLRNYWKQRGVPEEFMIDYITGSFNLGIEGFKKYVKQTGKTEREYSRQVYLRKEKLESSNTLT